METQTMTSFMGSETGAVDERVTKAMNASSYNKAVDTTVRYGDRV